MNMAHNLSMQWNNSIQMPENNETEISEISLAAETIVLFTGVFIIVIGIISNFLVIFVIYKVRQLRSTYNLFVINLLVTDTVLLGYLLPFNIATFRYGYFPLDNSVCVFNGVIANLLFPSSILTLMNIAIDRYITICHYKIHKRIYTERMTVLIIVGTWMLSIFLSVPALFGAFSFEYDPIIRTCLFSRFSNKLYTIVFLSLGIGVPVIVNFICYFKLFVYLRKTNKDIFKNWNNVLTRKRFMENIRLTYTLCALFILHIVFYLPFGIVSILGDNVFLFSESFHHVANFLCFANSGLNSILYGVFNSNIRKAILETLCCGMNKKVRNERRSYLPSITIRRRFIPRVTYHLGTVVIHNLKTEPI